MATTESLLEELTELITGKGFLEADYQRTLSIIQSLEEEEFNERLTQSQSEKLKILRARF